MDSPTALTTRERSINHPESSPIKTKNRFPFSYRHETTQRFGQLYPFYVQEGLPDEEIPLNSKHSIRAFQIQSPILDSVKLCKDYFSVPRQCIYRHGSNYERMYTTPVDGDDVPDDLVANLSPYFLISRFTTTKNSALNDVASVTSSSPVTSLLIENLINFGLQTENWFSSGSLATALGYRFVDCLLYKGQSIDAFMEIFWTKLLPGVVIAPSANSRLGFSGSIHCTSNLHVVGKKEFYGSLIHECSISQMLELFRLYGTDDFSITTESSYNTNFIGTNGFKTWFLAEAPSNILVASLSPTAEPVLLERLLAYQYVCVHFYTRDNIDYIYSADSYHEHMMSLVREAGISSSNYIFLFNNATCEYEPYSNKLLKLMLPFRWATSSDISQSRAVWCFWENILTYQASLRFEDYFTGARATPMAVGNVNVQVVSNQVNAVDIVQKFQFARLLNHAKNNRRLADFLETMFGVKTKSDPRNPDMLVRTQEFGIGSDEIENTANNQGAVVANLRGTASQFSFDYPSTTEVIVLGISYFDVPRIYCRTTDRHLFHRDRFDRFMPDMQYIGDQSIERRELSGDLMVSSQALSSFGYQSRNHEYKQRVSTAVGGFVYNLPHYAFIADDAYSRPTDRVQENISPLFIRSLPSEFDRFLIASSYISLAGYFHFVCDYVNECLPDRPLAYSPGLLR